MAELILYKSKDLVGNNLFIEYVTACIIKFCDYDPVQAEQIATIVYNNGKCTAMIKDYDELDTIAYLFEEVGIKTKIEV